MNGQAVGIAAVVMGLFCVETTQAAWEAQWKSAVSGSWSATENWLNDHAPEANENVLIGKSGSDYTVTLDAAKTSVGSIYIENKNGQGKATLSVGNDLLIEKAALTVNTGGVFEVTGGNVVVTNSGGVHSYVKNSGIWRVSGGTCRLVSIDRSAPILQTGGRLEVTGGEFSFLQSPSSFGCFYLQTGSAVDVSGTGVFRLESASDENYFGNGTVTVRGQGSLVADLGVIFGSDSGPKTMSVEIKDQGFINVKNNRIFGVNERRDGEAEVTISSSYRQANGSGMCLGGSLHVPYSHNSTTDWRSGGSGILNIGASASAYTGYYNVNIGLANQSSAVTGTVNVAGYFDPQVNLKGQTGVLIGVANTTAARNAAEDDGNGGWKPRYVGKVNVTGSMRSHCGRLIVGWGNGGSGLLNLSGGTLDSNNAWNNADIWAVIGMDGGSGVVRVADGGTATFKHDVCVGGCDPTWMGLTGSGTATKTKGLVEVLDGTFDVQKSLRVGAQGVGILRIGPKGLLKAKNLSLEQTTSSTLEFTADKTGMGTVTVSGAVTVTPGAKLTVDARHHGRETGWIRLMSCETLNGTFSPADITVLGPCDQVVVGERGGEFGIWAFVYKPGLLLLVK